MNRYKRTVMLKMQSDKIKTYGIAPGLLAPGLLLAFFIPHSLVLADADGPDFFQVRDVAAGDVLNIRTSNDWHSDKIGEIPHDGRCVRNLGCVGGLTLQEFTDLSSAEQDKIKKERPRWCQIEYQGQTGWVAGRYLQENEGMCD